LALGINAAVKRQTAGTKRTESREQRNLRKTRIKMLNITEGIVECNELISTLPSSLIVNVLIDL